MAAPVCLVEAAPRRAGDGVVVPTRLAGLGGLYPYRYGGEQWRAGIAALPKAVASLAFDGEQLGGGGVAEALSIRWAPATNAALAALAELYWGDARIVVRIGPENELGVLPPIAAEGLVLDASPSDGALNIALSTDAVDLKRPVLVDRFAGSGGIEGPAEWADLIKERAWGRCFNVPGRAILPGSNVWCFGDPRRPWLAFDQVRTRGVAIETLAVLDWQGTAEATLAALAAAVVPDGTALAAPSIACVKWWTEPDGDLRADIRGEIAGGYVESAPAIAARIVVARSAVTVDPQVLLAAVAARPAPFGWRVASDSATAAAEVSDLLADVSLSWLVASGQLTFRRWEWSAPTRAARSHAVVRRQVFKPVGTRKIGYRKNQAPMTRGDLAAIVFVRDITYEDGRPLADAITAAGETAIWDKVGDPVGTKPADNATNSADPSSPFGPGGTVGGTIDRLSDFDIAIAAAKARQDQLDTVTIPAIDAAVADAGERITAAKGRADAAYQQADQAIANAETVNRRVDAIVAEGGYDDTNVRAEIKRVDETAISRDDAAARRTETLEAQASPSGGNLVPNTALSTLDGWTLTFNPDALSTMTLNRAGAPWMIGGIENNLTLFRGPAGVGLCSEAQSALFAVRPGSTIQFYAFTASHRCRAWVSVFFWNDGGLVGYAGEHSAARINAGGQDINAHDQTGAMAVVVPVGATRATLVLRSYDVANDGYAWFSRPFVTEVKPGANTWAPYSPGNDRTVTTSAEGRITQAATAAADANRSVADLSTSVTTRFRGVNDTLATYDQRITTLSTGQESFAGRATSLEATATVGTSAAKNDRFAYWPDGQRNPVGWFDWAAEGRYTVERVTGVGSPYGVRTTNDANVSSGFYQVVPVTKGLWVIEVTAKCEAGSMSGAGITLHGAYNLDFLGDPDVNGQVRDSAAGETRSWAKVVDLGGWTNPTINFHAMQGWTGFGRGIASHYVHWYRVSLRPAGPGDIAGLKNAADLVAAAARIKSSEDVLADLPNRYAAASRTAALEAQVNFATDSGLQRTINSRIEDRASVIADGRLATANGRMDVMVGEYNGIAVAANNRMNVMVSEYNGIGATVTQQAGTIVTLDRKAAAYVKIVADAGGGRAALSLWSDQYGGSWALTGDGLITGNLTIDGSLTVRKLDRSTMTTYTQGSVSGSYGDYNQGLRYVPGLGASMYVRDGGTFYFSYSGSSGNTNSSITSTFNSIELLDAGGGVLQSIPLPYAINGPLQNHLIRIPNIWGERTVQWRIATRGNDQAASNVSNPSLNASWNML